ncbi:MAG TPA: hypothetical protein VD997_16215 [Phycisphaerales bacterium]|nr:hypothetical protein [Phycisphaerales bacterium]
MARRPNLANVTAQELEAELRRRLRAAGPLQRKRDRLLAKLAQIEKQIQALGGDFDQPRRGNRGAIPGRRRARNEKPLPGALHEVLKGRTMGIAEIAEAVQRAGFKTHSKNFRVMVNIALTKHPKLFKRVARGQYTSR